MKDATISFLIYLLLGSVGLPVFASFHAGLSVLAGPTGGYLIGFIFLALIQGFAMKYFDLVVKIRKNTAIPLVFMTYANVVFSYGTERFIKRAAEIGMDGLILPDVPFEEKEEFDRVCREYGLDLISLIAPTSHDRIRMIAKEASGFIYCSDRCGCFRSINSSSCCLTTDQSYTLIFDKIVKCTDCIGSASHAGKHCIREFSFFFHQLFLDLF